MRVIENGTAGTRTPNQRIMSHRGTRTFLEDNAKTTQSAADGAANFSQRPADDHRLLGVIEVWPVLAEDVKRAILRLSKLVSDDTHDVDDETAPLAGEAVSR